MCSFGEVENGKWYHYCGGAIVSENVIVTAAHCFFKGGYIRTTQIRTGDQNLIDTSDDDLVRTYEVSNIIKHPEYRAGYAKNDLAIVYTKTPIDFNANTNRISVPAINDPIRDPSRNYSSRFIGYGWYDDTLTASDALREADFTLFIGSYCEPLFHHAGIRHNLVNTQTLMCAGTDVSKILY